MDVALSHVAAIILGVGIGVAIALPWRPLIRRKVLSRDVRELSVALHKALDELEAEHIVDRRQGRGTFVLDKKADDLNRIASCFWKIEIQRV